MFVQQHVRKLWCVKEYVCPTILCFIQLYFFKTYDEAIKIPKLRKVMEDVIVALKINKTWYMIDLPVEKSLIGRKWVYNIKYKANGDIEWYKTRLITKGYTQLERIDYLDTYFLIVKITIVCLLLVLVATKNWHLEQMDANNTFLHGDLNEEVRITLP